MTDHLPECWWVTDHGWPCICERLRAYGERAYDNGVKNTYDSHYVFNEEQWEAERQKIRQEALQAARDAVDAAYDDERYAHRDNWGVSVVYKDLMLAAIDALPGES